MRKLFEKIRAAWRARKAFYKTPAWRRARRDKQKQSRRQTLTFGIEVKRCSECDRGDCTRCARKAHTDALTRLCNLPSCNDCGRKKTCAFRPEWGKDVRINCILWTKEEAET